MSHPPEEDRFGLRRQFLLALAFLTRLPVPLPSVLPEHALARAVWSFPLAGLVVGLAVAGGCLIGAALGVPAWAAVFLGLAVGAVMTGALHEDGLADMLDGLGGSTRARRLEIMRDSRIGSFGTLGLILATGLKAAALAPMVGHQGDLLAALLAAHIGARAGLPLLMRVMTPARTEGLGASAGQPTAARTTVALGLGALALLGALGPGTGAIALVSAAIGVGAVGALAQRRLGGYTGDILGAAEQIAEIAILLAACRPPMPS